MGNAGNTWRGHNEEKALMGSFKRTYYHIITTTLYVGFKCVCVCGY